jgi:hypothetical protein
MHRNLAVAACCVALVAASGPAATESASRPPVSTGAFPYATGQVIGEQEAESLREWLPAPFWAERRFFFHEEMQMEIGPPSRDYAPPPVYLEATERNRGKARLGPDDSLEGYESGQPFPMEQIDCKDDPDAGVKVIWNFVHRWQGFGAKSRFRYSYIDRGEVLPLHYEGETTAWILKHRPEPQFQKTGGDVIKGERRFQVVGFDVKKPAQAAGTRTLTFRYEQSYAPLATAVPEDTWLYARQIRRVRKVSQSQRSSAVAGTDFTFDDLFSFSGLPPQYSWRCVDELQLLAPMNTAKLGFPYAAATADFGPSRLSYASDRWELRDAIQLEMVPKEEVHPYSRKQIWIDRQTLQPLYSAAYDQAGALWKIITHNHRWSEDDLAGIEAREWYPGWEGVPEPRDLRVVSDAIVNVQTGTGNLLEFWESKGTPPTLRSLSRFTDVQRLRRGR